MSDIKDRILVLLGKFRHNKAVQYAFNFNTGRKYIGLKQQLLLGGIIIGIFCSAVIVLKFFSISTTTAVHKKARKNEEVAPPLKLELATKSIEGAEKWQSFLEDAIENEKQQREDKLKLLENTLKQSEQLAKEAYLKELEEIRARLAFTLNELDKLKADNTELRDNLAMTSSNLQNEDATPPEFSVTTILEDEISSPISSWNHIPATSYVTGYLLGGVAVSTSINSAAEPVPLVIRLTARGNLPKDFAVKISDCRLLASAYGDISSERAIIRAEELICEDKKSGLITSTKVAGIIYGDDGMNGIRGSVVSMSDKHLKSAFIGGLLSGFSHTVKGSSGFSITPIGTMNTPKKGMNDMAREGLFEGGSSAADKLADYHIKLAENISPVILVPGGTKVDVMFTRSVQIGKADTHDKINNLREKRNKE